MRAPHGSEGLHDADAGDELDHRGRHAAQVPVHLDGLLPHPPHHPRVDDAVDRHGGDRQQAEPPVDDEGVDKQGQGSTDGGSGFDGSVRDDRVYIVRIILDRLAHGPRVRRGEPRQRRGGEDIDHARAHDVAESHVRQVGEGQGHEVDAVAKSEGPREPHA